MKNNTRILKASLVIVLFFAVHSAYGFKNPYWNTKGEVIRIKELGDQTILAIFENKGSGYVELAHMNSEGTLISTAQLSKINQHFFFSNIYEYDNKYVVAMSSVEENPSDTIRYQEFRFYDMSLNFLYALKHIVDEEAANPSGGTYLNDDLTWAGMVTQNQKRYLRMIQFGLNGGLKQKTIIDLSEYDIGYTFVKVLPYHKGNIVFAFNSRFLTRFQLDSSMQLIAKDTFSQVMRADSPGVVYNIDWISDIVSVNDSQFVGIFGDTSNGIVPGDSSILNRTYQAYLLKIQDKIVLSAVKTGTQYYLLSLLSAALRPSHDYLIPDRTQGEIYVLHQYDTGNPDTQNFALRYTYNLERMPGLKVLSYAGKDTPSINLLQIAQSGSYLVGGFTKNNNGFIGKVDSNGIVSGIKQGIRDPLMDVFPNPGTVTINGLPPEGTIELFNIVGSRFEFTIENTRAYVVELNSGVYFYRIRNEHNEVVGSGKWIRE